MVSSKGLSPGWGGSGASAPKLKRRDWCGPGERWSSPASRSKNLSKHSWIDRIVLKNSKDNRPPARATSCWCHWWHFEKEKLRDAPEQVVGSFYMRTLEQIDGYRFQTKGEKLWSAPKTNIQFISGSEHESTAQYVKIIWLWRGMAQLFPDCEAR